MPYVNVPEGEHLNARTGPSTGSAIAYYVPRGDQLTVLSSSGSWRKVKPTSSAYASRGEAWVSQAYLVSAAPSVRHDTKNYALSSDRNLAYKSFGRYTKNLQKGLNITTDGDFGPATSSAVHSFQASHSSLTADGIAGPATKSALWASSSAQARIISSGF
ncbi:MAG: peptidoglycan-binding protein [Streptococcaceae bacterium]|jgi:peptidoglycan hydrolase-like protein with peptidoglycan-binding domain|nr:peptidoglycan-binding protein [Streptococcaceae bacterium]